MSKFTSLSFALLTSLFASSAYAFIALPPSIFQDNDNTFYASIGGGFGKQHSGNWSGSADHAGINEPDNKNVNVGIGTAALGYGFKNYPFRIEVAYNFVGGQEFSWDDLEPPVVPSETESAKARIYSNLGLLNVYGDLPITENLIPFIKIGAGYGQNQAKFKYTNEATGHEYTSDSHSNNNFVWNASAGVNYALSENLSLGAEFTYLDLGKAYFDAYNHVTGDNESFVELDELTAYLVVFNLAYHF